MQGQSLFVDANVRTSTAEEIRIMKVPVGCPQDFSLQRNSLGLLGSLFPLSLCVWDRQSPSGAGGKEEGLGSAGVGCRPHPAALSSSYLSCPVNAAQYLQEAGKFSLWHLSINGCDHLDLDFVRSSLSPSSSVLRTAGAGQSLGDKSSNEQFMSCPQPRSEHIFILLGFFFKFPVFIMVVEKSRGGR